MYNTLAVIFVERRNCWLP